MNEASLPVGQLAPLVFMMMGPIGAMATFAAVSAGADTNLRRRMAVRATVVAGAAIGIAVLLGASVLVAWGASPGALIVAAGLLLGLAALRNLMGAGGGGHASAGQDKPSIEAAMSPIAIPTIASPYGIGVLIIFATFFPAWSDRLTILAITLAILGINFVAMFFAHRIMPVIGQAPLMVLGAVFGVLQLALGLQMIADGLRRLT
jgi:multiple antibiotic resistance protein